MNHSFVAGVVFILGIGLLVVIVSDVQEHPPTKFHHKTWVSRHE